MKTLHVSQETLLKILRQNVDSPLTMRELQIELGLSSPSVVHHHIQQLEKKGYLKRNPINSKDYIVTGQPERGIVYINKYGLAQCGPTGSILDGNPIDKIPIASRLLKFPSGDAFIVEAKGNSMEPKIKQGDIIIAKKQITAETNDLVICVNNSVVIIKIFKKEGKEITLHSLNAKLFPPIAAANDLRIEGIVKHILQY